MAGLQKAPKFSLRWAELAAQPEGGRHKVSPGPHQATLSTPWPSSCAHLHPKSRRGRGSRRLASQCCPQHAHTRPSYDSTSAQPQLCSEIGEGIGSGEEPGSGSRHFQACRGRGTFLGPQEHRNAKFAATRGWLQLRPGRRGSRPSN